MSVAGVKERLSRSYWVWRLYHGVVADAVAFQRPTKYSFVYDFLGGDLGCVMDLGCGPGVFTRFLCLNGSYVCAADIDEKSLSRTIARHARERNLAALVMRANQLPFQDASLDTVLFLEVLEHIEDDVGALREIHRVLAPSGKMVVSVPIPPGEVNEGEEWGHKREGYTFTEMKGLLEKTGFEMLRHAYAQFKFSRLAERLVHAWRRTLRIPAPGFLGWVSYADLLLDPQHRQHGDYEPACLIALVRKRIAPSSCLDKARVRKSG